MEIAKVDKTHLDLTKHIYECANCNKLFNWTEGCCWHGSIKQQENNPTSIKYHCSKECYNEFNKPNPSPNGK